MADVPSGLHVQRNPGNQTLYFTVPTDGIGHRIANTGVGHKGAFDFAKFDPISTDLDLIVLAALKFDDADPVTRQIAGPVQFPTIDRMRRETRGRFLDLRHIRAPDRFR